ncbi:hypothetical protein EDC18_10636 [Natranaerovirga pectinivora]|uniref:Uncharacterized protein n=1 Tax=Natranaerovirga pectinivora TaxID=682400 RepID=A0A4R3MJE9_9FIRM|nr:hypothetical protein [Natranaerovirga pectinivora]TCT14240.1 hypothetical protein EDC18_10636 [Natranaerovirga pectinivora]
MKSIYIPNNTPQDKIIDKIENEIIKKYHKFVILEFEDQKDHNICRCMIEGIKSFYDVFLILKTRIPQDTKKVEEYFSYGIHGIYFSETKRVYSKDELDKMVYATKIFPNGLVLCEANSDKETLDLLLKNKIIPFLQDKSSESIEYILKNKDFKKLLSKELLKYIPVYQEEIVYNLADKIKMKMILEGINLRQKLMVKQVEESFNSSGL